MTHRTIKILSLSLFVLTLLWGFYTLIVYLGIPAHNFVFMQPDDLKSLDAMCGSGVKLSVSLCRGSIAIVPLISALFLNGSPFGGYVLISLLAWVGVMLYGMYKNGKFEHTVTLRPILLIVFFALSVWLIATCFSFGSVYNANSGKEATPTRQFYEPLPQVYTGVGEEGLAALQANYKSLQDRKCLAQIGSTQNGAKIFNIYPLCMQASLFARAGTQIALVLLFLFNLLIAGSLVLWLIRRLRPLQLPLLVELVTAFALGTLMWIAVLYALSLVSLLHGILVGGLFFGLPFVLFPFSWQWLKAGWQTRWSVDVRPSNMTVLLGWLIISYLALNFLNVVRPFPIGWDDLGSYLNRPRLLASYGSFIPSMSQFQWEFLSAIGYLIFGITPDTGWDIVGSTFAMEINWAAGLLAALSVYAFARTYFGKGSGLIATMLYYFLPMVGHFSFADMKIDNAVFFTSTVAVLLTFVYAVGIPSESDDGQPATGHMTHPRNLSLLFLAGMIAGLSFGMKPTAILSILMIGSILLGSLYGVWGFAGSSVLGLIILNKFGPLDLKQIIAYTGLSIAPSQNMFLLTMLIVGAGLIGYAMYKYPRKQYQLVTSIGVLTAGILVSVLPWGLYNLTTVPSVQILSINSALKAFDGTAPNIVIEPKKASDPIPTNPTRYLPEELKLNMDDPACKSSARTEELDRYWGFDKSIMHYITLVWRQVMNLDAVGYYVTLIPLLLLFPLVLLLPYFWRRSSLWLRLLFGGTLVFLVQWMFVGNGIAWYGLGMFLGFAVGLEALVARAPDQLNKWLMTVLIFFSIAICMVNRFWQFDTQKNLFEYPLGKVSAQALREMTIPQYDDITKSVLDRHASMPNEPYTYRMGTFISYFIPKNREILPLADHQLNVFNCLNQEQDHALTLKRLKALGFNSIIFDTNTATIEKDPNGSLHKKVDGFINFANNQTIGLETMVYDPGNGIAYILLP
ncbi:MAG: hypothetical protein KBD00_05590 [Candidatus Peribacteraceae bacterium]|nr:hypothetical protein [Candidatus Peribacteraceae bacterium]